MIQIEVMVACQSLWFTTSFCTQELVRLEVLEALVVLAALVEPEAQVVLDPQVEQEAQAVLDQLEVQVEPEVLAALEAPEALVELVVQEVNDSGFSTIVWSLSG